MTIELEREAPATGDHTKDSADPPDATAAPPLGRRVRIAAVAALGVAVVYALACVVYNLPSSTVKVRAQGADNAVMQPWFEQDWQLFAPTPATANAHIMVTARTVSATGQVTSLPAFDIQYAIEDKPKSDPLLPTKQPGMTLAAQERFAAYQKQLVVINQVPAAQRPALHAQLDRKYRPTLDGLDRLISYEAHRKYPSRHLTAVQATFTQQAMTPFSERDADHAPTQPVQKLLTTSWLPYVSGIGGS